MQLFTEVNIAPFPFNISYQDKLLMLGSCFATSIGNKLQRLKFSTLLNPFGVLYNPASIANSLELLLSNRLFTPNDLHFANGCWFSFYHHSSFSAPDKGEALERMNAETEKASEWLQQLDVLAITLGTAIVYEDKKSGSIVSNCHKQPNSMFFQRMMSVDEVCNRLSNVLSKLNLLRPQLKIIVTVSPIRHIKDGARVNQLSKSTLLLACHTLCQQYKNMAYFPAYELMMDELRDYRFYANDMLHPSPLAIEYIWQKFAAASIDKETQSIMNEVEKLLAAKEHRPFNPNTNEHKTFLATLFKKTDKLQERYPFLNLNDELSYFKS